MKRRIPIETGFDSYAVSHGWPTLIAEHGADQHAVMAHLRALLGALPGRRRVRALELASLLEARLDQPLEGGRALNEAIAASLRADHQHAFPVDRGADAAGTARPILITASPGSGSSLLQRFLADATGYPMVAGPAIADLDIDRVPGPSLLQVHAPNDRRTRKFVAGAEAEVITIARHPLDVLLSALRSFHLGSVALDWLDGAVVDSPATLRGASPTSEQFVQWATDKGAARLLDVTRRWWRDGTTHRVRYEDLVADPPSVIGKLLAGLGLAQTHTTVGAGTTPGTAALATATPGLGDGSAPNWWRDFVPVETATRIHRAHRRVFLDLDYTLTAADPLLDAATAAANWRARSR